MKKLLSLLLLTFIFANACSLGDTKRVRIHDVRLNIPQEWSLEKGQGIDSIVGKISGEGVQITYDYGWQGGDFLRSSLYSPDNYDVIEETIDGGSAKIFVPKAYDLLFVLKVDDPGKTSTETTLSLYASGITEGTADTVLEIFRSVDFK